MLNAGKLRHRVEIQKPVETQNSNTGAMNIAWQTVRTIWAEIAPISAKELLFAQAENSKITGRITIRYCDDIDASFRLYHAAKNKYYNIEGILSDRDSGFEYLTLPVSEGVRYVNPSIDSLPVCLEIPVITGTPQIGLTLTATPGIWANEPIGYSYQWYLNDMPITSATAQTWVVSASTEDIVTVGVVASNIAGNSDQAISDSALITA